MALWPATVSFFSGSRSLPGFGLVIFLRWGLWLKGEDELKFLPLSTSLHFYIPHFIAARYLVSSQSFTDSCCIWASLDPAISRAPESSPDRARDRFRKASTLDQTVFTALLFGRFCFHAISSFLHLAPARACLSARLHKRRWSPFIVWIFIPPRH